MSKWNDLSKKLPKINTYVYVLDKDFSEMGYGKLAVCTNHMFDEDEGFFKDYDNKPDLAEGDIFWMLYGDQPDMDWNICWDSVEDYPYWITPEDFLKFIINKLEIKQEAETNRFDILDL